MPKELENLVTLPDSLAHCWQWFTDLNNTRPAGFGMSPISFTEISAYFTLFQIPVEPWEVEIIKMFDHIALQYNNKTQAEAQAQAERKKTKNK